MRVNRKQIVRTHEEATAKRISPEQQLRRSILACLLWEDTFYEDGVNIAERISSLVPRVDPETVAQIAVEAREKMKLRHAPLWLVRVMAKLDTHKGLVSSTLERIIQRPDELTEFLALYWQDGKQPISKQVKKGLSRAFRNFDAYQLAKYDRDYSIKLRDVMMLCHPKPASKEQNCMWKQLIEGTLPRPNTWESALVAGKDKKETFTTLLKENKLGAMALLRNLRLMTKVGVEESLIREGIQKMKTERVLPFRFITAAKYAPHLEDALEKAMFKCLTGYPTLPGKTILLVDVSWSMMLPLSSKSEMTRVDTAVGLAILVREICEEVIIYTFSDDLARVAPRRGFALRDAILKSQQSMGTYLGKAVRKLDEKEKYDRLIVLTDEQSHDCVSAPKGRGYVINIASYENGVGYGDWIHIDGWSEAILHYIAELENLEVILTAAS